MKKFLKNIQIFNIMKQVDRRLYVLCNETLRPVYACVQGAHAVANYLINHEDLDKTTYWRNEYLVFLKADLTYWENKLRELGKDFSKFYEPDLDNELTAIAVEDNGDLFKDLRLIR